MRTKTRMKEQDFDNLFGSKLPDFTGHDWRDLEGRLDRHDLQRKLVRLMWALPMVGAVLLGLSAVLYHQLTQTQKQVKDLESKLVTSHTTGTAGIVMRDSIRQKVFVYDTVYQNVVKKRTKYITVPENVYYQKPAEEQVIVERNKFLDLNKLDVRNILLNASNGQYKYAISPPKMDSATEDSVIEQSKFSLIPKSVTIGLLAGYNQPSGSIFKSGDGSVLGFRTVLGYNNRKGMERWGLVLDFQKNALTFQSGPGDAERVGIPHVNPPNFPPRLRQAQIKEFSSYQLGAGIRYNLLFSEKFRPYFGLSWAMQLPSKYVIDYQFEDVRDWHLENISKTFDSSLPAITNIFGTNLGFNYQFSNHFSMGLELYYQTQFTNFIQTPALIGGKGGLSYRF